MALGRLPDGGGDGDEPIIAEINITPLTDIFLVLLIIFMITSSAMVESGPKVNLPQAGVTSTETKGVVVTVDPQQNVYVDGHQVARDGLQGDRDVILGDVVHILDEARNAGAEEVAIAATRKGP